MGKANGTIRCRISGESGCQPHVAKVTFTPDQQIKHGKHQFVAFVPEDVPKGQQSGKNACKAEERAGFVLKLCNGSIELGPGQLGTYLLSHEPLGDTKVTVVVSHPSGCKCPELKALVIPAE